MGCACSAWDTAERTARQDVFPLLFFFFLYRLSFVDEAMDEAWTLVFSRTAKLRGL